MPKIGVSPGRVICGDCRDVGTTLGKKYQLIFADPPFNIGQEYKGYIDRVPPGDYSVFTLRWVAGCADVLAKNGVLCLHGPDALVELYLNAAPMAGLARVGWVNWHYRFGQCGRSNWIDSRCHCLIYAKSKEYKWRPEAVLVESDRVAYGDKRVAETERGGRRLPGTIWGVPSDGEYWGRIQGNNQERRPGHPNQLPELYLARLIKAYTDVGDRVLDPFGGSGTTMVVAEALGRLCDTIDVSEANCKSILQRRKKGAVRV